MRLFPAAFVTNGVFIVTRAGFELTCPCVLSPYAEPIHHGTTGVELGSPSPLVSMSSA